MRCDQSTFLVAGGASGLAEPSRWRVRRSL